MDPNQEVSTVPTYKRIIYACLAGLLIVALVVVIGFGIHHHHDTLQSQMIGRTWSLQMLYNNQNIYKHNVAFTPVDSTDAKMRISHTKPINVPIHFYNSKKQLQIGNKSQGEILQSTTNTRDNHYFTLHRVYKQGLTLHKHMNLLKHHVTFNFIRHDS